MRTLALVALAGTLVGGLAEVASADCEGPTVTYTGGEVAHGDIVKVEGAGFGDNCYDTGPPPPGEGSLGRPLEGVEVYIEQGGDRHLVAVGDTDEGYSWQVDIVMPQVLDMGEARITAVADRFTAFDASDRPLDITSEAVDGSTVAVVGFGEGSLPRVAPVQPATRSTDWRPLLGLSGILLLVTGAAVAVSQRRRGST